MVKNAFYDFSEFPRWDYNFDVAPTDFRIPQGAKDGNIFPPVSTHDHYFQGLYMTVILGSIIGVFLFTSSILYNCTQRRLHQGRRKHVAKKLTKFRTWVLYIATAFTLVSLGFAVAVDLSTNEVADVADSSYDFYHDRVEQGQDIEIDALFTIVKLQEVETSIYSPALKKEIDSMVSDLQHLLKTTDNFLSDAREVSWVPGSDTVKLVTKLVIVQFIRVALCAFVLYLLLIRPKWFYNKFYQCAPVYITLNLLLFLVWFWCCAMLTSTIVISDVCDDMPGLIEDIKVYFDVDRFTSDVIDFYTQCTEDMESPFSHYISDMDKYLTEAKLGLSFLKFDEKLHPDIVDEVDYITKKFEAIDSSIDDLEAELNHCEKIHNYYTTAVDNYICGDVKSNLFLCLIFQWSAIFFIIIARTFKCYSRFRNLEGEHPVVNDINGTPFLFENDEGLEGEIVVTSGAVLDSGRHGSHPLEGSSRILPLNDSFLNPRMMDDEEEVVFPRGRSRSKSS